MAPDSLAGEDSLVEAIRRNVDTSKKECCELMQTFGTKNQVTNYKTFMFEWRGMKDEEVAKSKWK
tara:strand:- start:358 stop:552 length:195 start_codon:yes stop_codon:yes gene_type:complete